MKRILAVAISLLMILALAAPVAYADDPYITITISADRAGDEAQMVMVNYIVDNVETATNGRVQMKLITPGTMGSLTEMCDQIQMGTLGMAAIPESLSASFLSTNLGFLNLPGLFSGYEDVAAAFDNEGWLGSYLSTLFEKDGFKRLGLVDNGFRTLGSRDKPIIELEDFKNVKIRVPEVPENIFQFQQMGALPVAISSSELLNALENGTVDAVDQSITNYVSNGIEGSVKYIYLIYDRYSSSSLLMNLDLWNQLTEEDQGILAEICEEACARQFEASVQITQDYIDRFSADGTWEVAERSDSVDAALKDITLVMLDEFGGNWDEEIIELVKDAIA